MSDEQEQEEKFVFVDKRRRYEDDDSSSEGADEATEVTDEKTPQKSTDSKASEETPPKAPPIDFATFVLTLSSSAIMHLGAYPDPVSGQTSLDLDKAKQTIDLIAIMEEKTKGNLTDDEERLMSHVLYDLRMKFVEATNKSGIPK